MDELIERITAGTGLDDTAARSAVRIILSFLHQEGDREKVARLIEHIPGAEAFVEGDGDDAAQSLGGFGGLMGGGLMAVAGRLQALGLGMGDIQTVTRQLVDFARERAGRELVDEIVASIPGLGQFA